MEGVRAGRLETDWQGRPELKFWSCKAQLEVVVSYPVYDLLSIAVPGD